MAKTIKEIADNCGVPEQTVCGWCRRNHVAKGSGFCNIERWVQLKFQVAECRKSGIMNK